MDNFRVFQYGCGKMSSYTMRYVYENGYSIVGACDVSKDVIGKDIGQIIGCEDKGVIVSDVKDVEQTLKELKPDICIITTMSLMSDLKDAYQVCAELGINAISTCEEAFFPMNSSPKLTKELDFTAKLNGCTLTGSGYQDVAWGSLITALAGTTHNITKIKGSSSYNVEDYGIALAKAHGAGFSLEQFDKEIASADNVSDEERNKLIANDEFIPSYMWSVNGWLCDKLNLTVVNQTQKCVPITHDKDLESSTLGMTIKAGDAIGMSAVVTTTTKEGITIESECIGKVYAEGVFDKNEWTVEGEPNTTITVNKPQTVELTCATIVNRIPDVINAKFGFIPTSRLGELRYVPMKNQ